MQPAPLLCGTPLQKGLFNRRSGLCKCPGTSATPPSPPKDTPFTHFRAVLICNFLKTASKDHLHFRTLLAVIWKSLAHWPINFCISHKQGAILAGNFYPHFYLKLLTHLLSPAGVAAHPTDPTFEVKLRPTQQSRLKQPAALLRSDWSIRSCADILHCHWPTTVAADTLLIRATGTASEGVAGGQLSLIGPE